jgi:AcrR family transcriptional regulator
VSATTAGPTPPRKRRARGSISAEEILQGAYDLVSEESLGGLSMPRLAQRLGVGVTSIYWYFRSKDDLLDTLAERAMTEFVAQFTVPDDLSWDDHLRAYFHNYRRLFLEDSLLCDLIVMRAYLTPQSGRIAAQRIDRILQIMVDTGFQPDAAMHAYQSLSIFTEGSVARARNAAANERQSGATTTAFADMPDLRVFPLLRQPHPLSLGSDEDFEFGLENAIRGLRSMLADSHVELPHTELPHTELPHTELPHTELPHTELPHTELPHTAQK